MQKMSLNKSKRAGI